MRRNYHIHIKVKSELVRFIFVPYGNKVKSSLTYLLDLKKLVKQAGD